MSDGEPQVSVLTAGRDRPYALGLAAALAAAGVKFDFVGSNEVDSPELHSNPQIRFLNLRGEQSIDAGAFQKILRVLRYYWRLIAYAAGARPEIFHILWNNKFEWFDRTLLMVYYRLLGKKICFTVHNVNVRARDGGDSWFNRATLKFQYRCCDHFFLHTERMKTELIRDFGVPEHKTSVIPFGINSTVPDTALTPAEARAKLNLKADEKVMLFFGNIAPYKGVEFLAGAFIELAKGGGDFRLIIAGRPKGSEEYWAGVLAQINNSPVREKVLLKIEYVPDAETEVYFKAADVLVLPYTHIFQSGVLFLSYNFGLPVIATDVGALKDDIETGKTGWVVPPCDAAALVQALKNHFASELFTNLATERSKIKTFAHERYSWSKVAEITTRVYAGLLK
ncbi:MAG TPA: glycosyltransferase family 4 protein [Candidatus Sulfotelmatobacter sp.]|jgi:glycosyltransferase involved in cell wall biosynthesis|nr:glycosyltransferase family 4 protein [Candidatus Sulfotelmatobacter sp.]